MAARRRAEAVHGRRTALPTSGGHALTRKSFLRRAATGALAALALGALPAAASADGLNVGLDGCPAQTIEHPFARWRDNAGYVLAPGGTFEARWSAGS